MTINPKFKVGDPAYLKTDPDQYERIVLGYVIQPGAIMYTTQLVNEKPTDHYDFELTGEPDTLKQMDIKAKQERG